MINSDAIGEWKPIKTKEDWEDMFKMGIYGEVKDVVEIDGKQYAKIQILILPDFYKKEEAK